MYIICWRPRQPTAFFFLSFFLDSQSIEQLIVRYRGEIQDKDKVLDRVKSEMKSLTENIRAAEVECKNAKSHVQRTKHLLHQAEDEYKKEQEDIEKEDSGADEARCVFEKERERESPCGFFPPPFSPEMHSPCFAVIIIVQMPRAQVACGNSPALS